MIKLKEKWCRKQATYNYIKTWSDDEADRLGDQHDQEADDEENAEADELQWPAGHDVDDDGEEETR